MSWQPIETAPKDATMILLYQPRHQMMYTAAWVKSEVMGPVWATPDSHVIFGATYWHVLPEPPK